jgi:methionine aminopeptidase
MIYADVDRQYVRVTITSAPLGVHPDATRTFTVAMESFQPDRQIGAAKAAGRAAEISILIDERRKHMEAGIKQCRVMTTVTIGRKRVRQLHFREGFSKTSLQDLYALERSPVF